MHSTKLYNTIMALKPKGSICWCESTAVYHSTACLKELTRGMCRCTIKRHLDEYTFDYACKLFVRAKNPDLLDTLFCPKCGKPAYFVEESKNVQE